MSTRANVVIKSPIQGLSFYYQICSDGYPERIAPLLLRYDGTPESLKNLDLEPGQVGNFYYFYELDVTSGTLKIWDSKIYWQNAPVDWKEKGYNCWKGENGRYGYSNWRKSKRLDPGGFTKGSPYKGLIKLVENCRFTSKQLSQNTGDYLSAVGYYMKKLRYNPTKVYTWLSACEDYYNSIYLESLDEQALKINSNYVLYKEIANWRLKVAA